MESTESSANGPAATNEAGGRSRQTRWIPSLYFTEGLPYVVVMTVAVIMYKRLGVSNADIAWYTSWLYLPWVVKPFWSPIVEAVGTRRGWTVAMQAAVGLGLAATAYFIPASGFLTLTLWTLSIVAFCSATHDIAADGFYMLALGDHDQAWWVGIRSTFYRLAMITGQGLLVMLAGYLEVAGGLPEVEVQFSADANPPAALAFDPAGDYTAPEGSPEQAIVAAFDATALSTTTRPPQESNKLIAAVKQWNRDNGFIAVEEVSQQEGEEDRRAWVVSLEEWIKTRFGPAEPPEPSTAVAGDLVAVPLRLAQPVQEGDSVIVTFEQTGGDKSFKLVEGSRFEVTAENSSMPFYAVVQVDPKLDKPSEAVFSARSGDFARAWSQTFYLLAGIFAVATAYHLIALPKPAADGAHHEKADLLGRMVEPLASFFRKPGLLTLLAFLMLYRFSEAQLVKLAAPFLLDTREAGGLALTTGEVGVVYGTVGVLMLTLGGILGGLAAARNGLKHWLWWMVLAINLPNGVYLLLSIFEPESLLVVNLAVAVEQFGYGFGFTAYMLYMLYASQGEHQTVHYAICTGFMALGMMIPGMFCGWLQELIGYENFFKWVLISTLPSFAICALLKVDPAFGKKTEEES
ncbi:MAG: MFS transporter [Planctomycetota bacterium]